MSPRRALTGAIALLAAPAVAIAATLVQPTLSDEAPDRVAALTAHRGAAIAGLTLNTIAAVLLVGGVIWLALVLAARTPGLAMAGGILGVFGALLVVFENGVAASAPAVVAGLDPAAATATLQRVASSTAVSGLEPLSLLGDVGLAALGVGVAALGAPRWAAAAIAVGALGEGAGFATGTKGLVIAAFALMLAGLVPAVRIGLARRSPRHAGQGLPVGAPPAERAGVA